MKIFFFRHKQGCSQNNDANKALVAAAGMYLFTFYEECKYFYISQKL